MSKNFELLRRAGYNAGYSLEAGQTLKPPTPGTIAPFVPPQSKERPAEWVRALQIIHKHWRLSALFAVVVMGTVTLVTFLTRPIYEPSATLEVDPPGEAFSLNDRVGSGDPEYLETQAKNLTSDKLAIAVIRKLHLDQVPEFSGENRPAERQAAANVDRHSDVALTPAESAALGSFHAGLKVTRDTSSRLIKVSFASHDPRLAAAVTNTVLSTFIEQNFETQHDAIMQSTVWLSRQLDDVRTRMEESNRVLANFQQKIGVADVDANKSTYTEQMAELDRQLTQAQADRIQLEALLNSVKSGSPDALPEIRSNPVVQGLTSKLADVRAQLSQDMVVYGQNHPTVKKLRSQADELQNQLDGQKTAILNSLRTSYAAAHAREQLMNAELKGATSQVNQMARYNALKKEAEANADLYNNLYARIKQAGIAAASNSSTLRIVDEARVLNWPTRPKRALNLMAGFLVALLGGIALAFLREQLDNRIFTPEDVRYWLGASNVGVVPMFFQGHAMPPGNGLRLPVAAGTEKFAPGIRYMLQQPHSPEAEAVRALYTSIMLSSNGSAPQVILVVSAFPGEGKTTVAVNLAMTMAQHGSTCLLDADLRRGRAAAAFGISKVPGLTDVLSGAATLDQTLVPVPGVAELTVVPAHAGHVQAGQLVCSEAMQAVIQQLRQRFRFVVIDSAPLLPFADGRSLSTLADGLIFVSRSAVTTREVVQRSLELLHEVHAAPVLEFVLNAADLRSANYRYYQYGYDYYEPSTSVDGSGH